MTRDKIREAIELLRTRSDAEGSSSPQDSQAEQVKTSAQPSVVVLEALMEIEAEESSNNEERSEASSTETLLGGQQVKPDSGARKPIQNKVMDILEAHQGNAQIAAAAMEPPNLNSFSAPDTSVFPPTPTDGFQDLDVLPLLYNDPDCNFWQFLDFNPPSQILAENGSFSAIADLQTLDGSTPFMPSPVVTHSMGSFGTPEFAHAYSNTDGTDVTDTSLSSIKSGTSQMERRK